MDRYSTITEQIEQSIAVKNAILESDRMLKLIEKAAFRIIEAYKNGN